LYQIDMMSRVPVYEQLISQTERFIVLGILKEGDKMPSVRSLASSLSVNPNTIQKAFGMMDQKGLITSVPGRGCFVTKDALSVVRAERRSQLGVLKEMLKELAIAGITREELIACIDEVFPEKKEEKK